VNGLKVNCQIAKIRLNDAQSPDWDDSMKIVRFVERGSLVPPLIPPQTPTEERPKGTPRRMPGAPPKARQPPTTTPEPVLPKAETSLVLAYQSPRGSDFDLMKVIEIKDEPSYEMIAGKSKEIVLKVFAVADYIRYQTSVTEIEFSPTMMFETRIVRFKIQNPSQIRFEYSWITTQFGGMRTNYALVHGSPFAIVPTSGFIEAGQTTIFEASFSPEEVDDFSAHMRCEIPFLGQTEPPSVYMWGRSRRPVCHFNIKMSDYISAGRRHPNYTDPLPDGVKVIEMFSHKIGERTVSKFEIINTTEAPYEIVWQRTGSNDDSVIQCNTPRAVISSGKRHTASFSFTPVSVKTLESLWHFSVPEHEIRVYLLIVGRIMPY
jgi:hydrocephalus-inducing protein